MVLTHGHRRTGRLSQKPTVGHSLDVRDPRLSTAGKVNSFTDPARPISQNRKPCPSAHTRSETTVLAYTRDEAVERTSNFRNISLNNTKFNMSTSNPAGFKPCPRRSPVSQPHRHGLTVDPPHVVSSRDRRSADYRWLLEDGGRETPKS